MAKTPSECNKFNSAIAEFGLMNSLNELRNQCDHFADVADDVGERRLANKWNELAKLLDNAKNFCIVNGLTYPKKAGK